MSVNQENKKKLIKKYLMLEIAAGDTSTRMFNTLSEVEEYISKNKTWFNNRPLGTSFIEVFDYE